MIKCMAQADSSRKAIAVKKIMKNNALKHTTLKKWTSGSGVLKIIYNALKEQYFSESHTCKCILYLMSNYNCSCEIVKLTESNCFEIHP